MRSKNVTLAVLGVGVAVIAALAWFFLSRSGELPSGKSASSRGVPASAGSQPNPPESATGPSSGDAAADPASSAMPAMTASDSAASPPSPTAAGAANAPRDRRVTPDTRVRNTGDGKTILTVPFDLSRQLHASNARASDDLGLLEEIFRYYRKIYGENPVVHSNRDVVDALAGANPKAIVMFDPEHPDRNPDGELLDRYGNPYFFHAVSRIETDIVSAGPDGERGTGDDLHSNPRAGEELQLRAAPALD